MNCFNLIILALVTLSNFVKSEFIYSCTQNKTIALTFDDGPHKYTNDLVDYMSKYDDIKITFFHVGKFHYPYAIDVPEFQKAMKKAHKLGYQIASHTFGHKISDDSREFKKSLDTMDDFIEKVIGERPRYFRAPKGHCYEKCLANLKKWDYRLIQWDTDTKDWDYETSGSIDQRIEDSINFLKKRFSEERDSYLILMHDSLNHTVYDISRWIVEKSGMREKGYRFVTVAECLGDKDGMYRSKKTIKPTKINIEDTSDNHKDNTNAEDTTSDNAKDNSDIFLKSDNFHHHLESKAYTTYKPITFISCLCLLISLLYIMI